MDSGGVWVQPLLVLRAGGTCSSSTSSSDAMLAKSEHYAERVVGVVDWSDLGDREFVRRLGDHSGSWSLHSLEFAVESPLPAPAFMVAEADFGDEAPEGVVPGVPRSPTSPL